MSDEKWEEEKKHFPYSEIPFIVDHALQNSIDSYNPDNRIILSKDELIKRHFHGFSAEQWDELKKQHPYSDIFHIIDHAIVNCMGEFITPYIEKGLKKNVLPML